MGKRALKPAVFLDRDGVINEAVIRAGKPFPPADIDQLRIVEDAGESLQRLRDAGYALIVVTNQPDVARGTASRGAVDAIHQHLSASLAIDAIYACFHDDRDACACRKPRPGLLLEAAHEHGLDLGHSYLIGDRWKDIDAGWAAGVEPVLIDFGYDERAPAKRAAATVPSIKVATDWILNQRPRVNSN
jgi:D-glycero-D-manno-heptose 1,7-bisphosphate phosphatase